MKKVVLILIILGLIGFGCAQKKVVAPEAEQPKAMVPEIKEQQSSEIAKPLERIKEEQIAKVESTQIPSKVEEISGMFKDIHFDFDRYDLREDAKPILKSVADYLIKNSKHKVLIEGHCDERGTNEYNLALGDKRARAAKEYIVSLGVPSNRIDTISYGEEKPLCKEPNEDCWAKNRRDHFVIIKEKR